VGGGVGLGLTIAVIIYFMSFRSKRHKIANYESNWESRSDVSDTYRHGPFSIEVTKPITHTDCFLTHDWGDDETGRSNHDRVAKINQALKNRGLITWFDEDRMEGNVRRQMTDGIENTQCVLVFITNRYRNKVNGTDDRDNCRYEFNHAVEQLGPQNMISVVMEESMLVSRDWKSELGAALSNKLYINMTSDDPKTWERGIDDIESQVRNHIKRNKDPEGEQHNKVHGAV
jgi:hypothetical protein